MRGVFRIDAALLERCARPAGPAECRALAADLGGLARWLLRPEVLDQAAASWQGRGCADHAALLRRRPDLPTGPGSCWVAFAAEPGRFALLREAFALPLRWVRGAAWGRDVPPPLQAVARNVLDVMHAYKSSGPPSVPADWSLRLNVGPSPDRYDLTGLGTALGAGSGWAALAAGWLTATRGGVVDPSVGASAGWGDGFEPVGHLQAKAALAREWGVRRLYVVPSQAGAGGILAPLGPNLAHPLDGLRPLALALAVRPDGPPPWEPATAYHHLLARDLADPAGAAAYYREAILPAVVGRLRDDVGRARPELIDGADSLVTLLSGSPELVELSVRVFRPRRCLVLYTGQTEPAAADRLRLEGSHPGCRFEWQRMSRDVRPGGLPASVTSFLARAGGPALVDLTPGTKLMTLALDRDVPRGAAHRFYFMTEQRRQEIQFGTYEVVLL